MSQPTPLLNPAVPEVAIASELDRDFAGEVNRRSHTDLNRCYQCRTCGNGCPFVEAMDYSPHQVIRLVQYGLRPQALECATIWICVSCHTCSSECPNAIDIAAIMDTLRSLALEERAAIPAKDILALHRQKYYQAEVENILTALGGKAVWGAYNHRCCGSFLSAVRPEVVTSLVNEIIGSAVQAGAECLVTSCAMCQLNLEVRCTAENKLPIFHFSEILALALGATDYEGWFTRHLVDPRPLLEKRRLIG